MVLLLLLILLLLRLLLLMLLRLVRMMRMMRMVGDMCLRVWLCLEIVLEHGARDGGRRPVVEPCRISTPIITSHSSTTTSCSTSSSSRSAFATAAGFHAR